MKALELSFKISGGPSRKKKTTTKTSARKVKCVKRLCFQGTRRRTEGLSWAAKGKGQKDKEERASPVLSGVSKSPNITVKKYSITRKGFAFKSKGRQVLQKNVLKISKVEVFIIHYFKKLLCMLIYNSARLFRRPACFLDGNFNLIINYRSKKHNTLASIIRWSQSKKYNKQHSNNPIVVFKYFSDLSNYTCMLLWSGVCCSVIISRAVDVYHTSDCIIHALFKIYTTCTKSILNTTCLVSGTLFSRFIAYHIMSHLIAFELFCEWTESELSWYMYIFIFLVCKSLLRRQSVILADRHK